MSDGRFLDLTENVFFVCFSYVDQITKDSLEEGGLPRANVTNDADKFALFNLQVYALECYFRQTPGE